MKNAAELCAPFQIDPFPGPLPGELRPAWMREAPAAGPAWIYHRGDPERFLLQRLRHENFRNCAEVYHPGLFSGFRAQVFFRRRFTLDTVPQPCPAVFRHSGQLGVKINGRTVAGFAETAAPRADELDLAPFLVPGANDIVLLLSRADEPPAVWLDSPAVRTGTEWECSLDWQHWEDGITALLPDSAAGLFPHQDRLPLLPRDAIPTPDGLYDAGALVLARPVIEVTGAAGAVRCIPGESEDEAANRNARDFEQRIETLNVRGPGSVSPDGKMAFRWLRLETAGDVRVSRVGCLAETYPVPCAGAFACSDPQLTRIWTHSAYTLRVCMREFFLDGIKRDRLPWAGDLAVAILGNAFTFADPGIVRRTLCVLAPDNPDACHVNGILDYSLYWIIGLHQHHLYFDDPGFVRQLLPQVRKTLAALAAGEDRNGMVLARPGDWVFLDWAEMAKTGAVAAAQMLYVQALEAAAVLEKTAGTETAAADLRRRARRLRAACRARFWNAERNAFVENAVDGVPGRTVTRHANFLALLAGVAAPAQRRRILEHVLRNPQIAASGTPYMRFFELAALAGLGRTDDVLAGLRGYWGGMLAAGATTFWEAFDPRETGTQHLAFYGRPFARSLCHAWAAGPLSLLSAGIFGLQPLEPGWRRFAVNSRPKTALDWACATIPTRFGPLRVELADGRVTVNAPPECTPEET